MQNGAIDSLGLAFKNSQLHFPTEESGQYIPEHISEWTGSLPAGIIAALTCLVMLAALPHLVKVLPLLPGCLTKWKESVNLYNSSSLSRSRDVTARAMSVPFILICSYYNIYPRVQGMPVWMNLAVTLGVFLGYLLARRICQWIFKGSKISDAAFKSAVQTPYTFFIICSITMSIAVGICKLRCIDDSIVRETINWIIVIIYGICLLRKTQIFTYNRGIISGILYLCTLEIIPGALLALSLIL